MRKRSDHFLGRSRAYIGQRRQKCKAHFLKALRGTLSEARLARYLGSAGNDFEKAFRLYDWNTKLSQSLYPAIQAWEVALRNRLNFFLIGKYNNKWPYDQRAERNFIKVDRTRLVEVKQRQERDRGVQQATTDSIVADLTAGFWVSQFSGGYDVPYAWRYNLAKIFPHDNKLKRDEVSAMCTNLLDVRNRIAHHEPIFHLDLPARRLELDRLLAGMCSATHLYIAEVCTFAVVLKAAP